MALHVHHAHDAELLVDALGRMLEEPVPDPFAPDVVAVPSRGIERWIAQRLSHRLGTSPGRGDGIAANVEFPFPGALISDVLARATGVDPALDPWRPDRLVWPLLDIVQDAAAARRYDLLGPLAVHVVARDGQDHPHRRLGAVRRVAELFDRYAVHRPAMLQAWAEGRMADPRGGGRDLDERSRWQALLWRAVRDRVGLPSGAERLVDATRAITLGKTIDGHPLDLALPDRVAVFGITALSPTSVDVLAALAAGPGATKATREVHLFVRHPSPESWRFLVPVLDAWRTDLEARRADGSAVVEATPATTVPTRDHDPTDGRARHPLLRAWGRDSRELQVVLHGVDAYQYDHSEDDYSEGARSDNGDAGPAAAPDEADDLPLLTRLQRAIIADQDVPDVGARPVLGGNDRSIQLHRCHGSARQVEVLRDVILHVLAEEPDLEPRDIIVQCPDIETYAPLVEAVFGEQAASDEDDQIPLRVQLADRSLTRTNPLLRVLADLLDLVDGRVAASAVADFCARGPVRRKFGFTEDDLAAVDQWLTSTGIRWGIDEEHRRQHGIPTDANTWREGLDRLLVGVAVADEALRTVHGVVPEDEVEGDAVDLAGRLAELVARLITITDTFSVPRPVGAWIDVLKDALGQLAAPTNDAPWELAGVDRVLEEVRDAVREVARETGHVPLSVREVRELLGDRLAGAPSRASHRTGALTVCTLVPMRSVPHEVVIWLGMDDEVFPRRTVPDGDDLLAAAPAVGDRDPRTEDRQLLLDALMAARRRLVVLTTGHDERTGDERPPAVPIGELCDVIDRTVTTDLADEHGREILASTAITVDHPLHGADARRFLPGRLGVPGHPPVAGGGPFGFDQDDVEAARTAASERHEPPAFLRERLAPVDEGGRVHLDDLVAFFHHPVQALLRKRFDIHYPRDGSQRADVVPVEVGGLELWDVGNRLLNDIVAGHDRDRAMDVLRRRGLLPPGDLADDALHEVTTTIDGLLEFAQDHGVPLDTAPRSEPIDVQLPDGRRLVGSVEVVDTCRRAVQYTRLGYKHRLAAWIELLALTAHDPAVPWRAVTLARGRSGAPGKPAVSVSTMRPGATTSVSWGKRTATADNSLGPADAPADDRRAKALTHLMALIEVRDRGLCGPALLPCGTAGAYAEMTVLSGYKVTRSNPRTAAGKSWTVNARAGFFGEDRDPAHLLVFGELGITELFDIPPEPEEDGDGWDADEPSRIGRLARRVWTPLLHAEEITEA